MSEDLSFPISTVRLRLRPYRDDDIEWMHRVFSQPEVARYLLDEPWSREVAARKLAERLERTGLETESRSLSLVVELDGAPIGTVLLWRTDDGNHKAGMGWSFDPAHHGHGYAREAAQALVDLAFDHYGLRRVTANMDGRNSASARVAEAIGMRREAVLRQDFFSKGEWTDDVVYGILHADR
ncbi:GNAT family N-acetyltransferase [Tsukamurella pseudospumae]|uniref:Acetyltransferase n=1 Tax=Tsukamurella pseudospumae TaxID=239498 RepID=A0A137YZJ5_9ACTN|nr:GNAT family N-acetyltransferase [Tsukamurella pseudospumae]KXO91366.1 acetyltransferase [Tsukamurella pseudospumae]